MADYYEILQVSPNAEREVIDAAYRRLARKYHPDVYTGPDAAQRMRELNEAYEALGDPTKRAEYDRARHYTTGQRPRAESRASGRPPPQPRADFSSRRPPDSSLMWTQDETPVTATGQAAFSGRVRNSDDEWSIGNAKVEVTVYYAQGRQAFEFEISVLPRTIPPKGEGRYTATRALPASAERYEAELTWEWVPP
jgi:curved DNA-binding protein CbpA